jgi:hypothetical protein
VVATRVLTGGLTSLVRELTVVRYGRRSRCVLRSWAPDNEHQDWILRAVEAEAAVLTALERTAVPAPRLVAFTRDRTAGGPALLMTRVPGRVWLMPRDRESLLSYGPDWKHFLPLQIDGRAPLEVDGMTSRMEEVLTLALRRT